MGGKKNLKQFLFYSRLLAVRTAIPTVATPDFTPMWGYNWGEDDDIFYTASVRKTFRF